MVKSALIYCDDLLAYSATFVRSQAEALQEFVPYYTGIQRVEGLPLPAERTLVVGAGRFGKLWKLSYKFKGFAPAFFERAQKLHPSLIHAHFGPDGLRALPLAQGLNIPLVVTMHGYDVTLTERAIRQSTFSHRTYLRHRSLLQKKATCFIAVSHFIQRTMLNQGFPPEKVKVHYIGVDTARFCPDSSISREPVVLFTGRLVEKKGCSHLIRAMAQVQRARPDVELVVIGDGPLRTSLEEQAKATLKRYRFLGRQSPEEVKAWMNRAQVFSVPSVIAPSGDAEAFGIVFAEAQAMGLPVASFASGGIPEAVMHGETGFLAPEGDWESLGKYILQLLSDSILWRRFSRRGQAWVAQSFDLHRQTRQLEGLYHQAMGVSQLRSLASQVK